MIMALWGINSGLGVRPERADMNFTKRITKKAQGVHVQIWQLKGYFQKVLRARLTLGSAWLKWYLSCSERSQ